MNQPQKTPRAAKLTREERRQLLLESAVSVFAERGIDGARHAHIAEHAQVSVPTVFVYFPNRDALIRSVLDHIRAFFMDRALRPFLSGDTVENLLWQAGRNVVELTKSHPDHIKVWVMWGAYFGEPYLELNSQFESEMVDQLSRLLEGEPSLVQSKSVRIRALLIISSTRLLAHHALQGESPEDLDYIIGNVINMIGLSQAKPPNEN